MTQYLLTNSDGDSDDNRVGLTSDSSYRGGVLGSDTYTASEFSQNTYLQLRESSEDYVAINSKLESSTITGLTVMAWVRSTDTNGEVIISSYDRSEYYRFNLVNGFLDCSFDPSGGGGDFSSGEFVADGLWHHVAAVYDAGEVRMYVDGRRVYTNGGNASEIGSEGRRYGFIGTGSEANEFDGYIGPSSYGSIDIAHHRLYVDAKTDTEVVSTFNGNPPTANLHEHLPLTSDDDGRLNDTSGNNRHGYRRNGALIYGSSEPTVFENAEDDEFSDWTVNSGSLSSTTSPAIDNYSLYHSNFGNQSEPRGAVKELTNSGKIDSFSFMFWETISNTSSALSFYNSNGNREFSVGTDNPAWAFDDVSGNNIFGNPPNNYENWMRFTITFDWVENTYTVVGENTKSSYTASHTGELYEGVDIAEVASGQADLAGYTGVGEWYLDEMYENPSITTTTKLSTLNTTNNTSSSPIGDTQATTIADQLGGGLTTTTPVASTKTIFSSPSNSVGTSTALSSALQDAFSTTTFGDSFADTEAGGESELFTHADQPADLNTASVVDAFVESFDTIQRTALGDAFTFVSSDTQLATTNTTQSLAESVASPLVAAETAALTVTDPSSFGESYAEVLNASTDAFSTTASGSTAVTLLGETEVATTSPQFDTANVELFAFVSPSAVQTTDKIAGTQTDTKAVALTENAVLVSLTPTLDIVVAVKKGETGVEGAFADSLASDVGASTFIKLAKTNSYTETFKTSEESTTTSDAITTAVNTIENNTEGFAESTTAALLAAAAAVGISDEFAETGAQAISTTYDKSVVDGDGFASSVSDAVVRSAVLSQLPASGSSSVTPETLSAPAQTLTEQGIVETETEAAAIVSQIVSTWQQSNEETATTSGGVTEEFGSIQRTGRPKTSAIDDTLQELVNTESVDSSAFAQSLPAVVAQVVSPSDIDASALAEALVNGETADVETQVIAAYLSFLFAAVRGGNFAVVQSGQNSIITNGANSFRVIK